MTLVRDTSVRKLESKLLQQMLGRPTRENVNNMPGAIAAVYAEAKTSHESSPPLDPNSDSPQPATGRKPTEVGISHVHETHPSGY